MIIDHTFRTVHRGMGAFVAELPAGIYKARFRSGLAVGAEHFEVAPGNGERLEIASPTLVSPSPVPLQNVAGVSSRQRVAVQRISSGKPLQLGRGSSLLLFIRHAAPAAAKLRDLAAGITLHALDGTLLLNVGSRARTAAGSHAGLHVKVAPGAYRLRIPIEKSRVEQVLICCAGWQTQLFLQHRDAGRRSGIDVANASVLMSRTGFRADDEKLWHAEAARLALARGRSTVSRGLFEQLCDEVPDNPMLGLYVAHGLLGNEFDADRARLINALQRVVPKHPDLAVLGGSKSQRIDVPPMLSSSWSTMVDASLDGRVILAPGSLAARMPPELLGDSLWLAWPENGLLTAEASVESAELDALIGAVAGSEACDEFLTSRSALRLTAGQGALLAYLRDRARMVQRNDTPVRSAIPERHDLARAFNVTLAAMHSMVDGLASKLVAAGLAKRTSPVAHERKLASTVRASPQISRPPGRPSPLTRVRTQWPKITISGTKQAIGIDAALDPELIPVQLHSAGMACLSAGHYQEARRLLQFSLELQRELYGPYHPSGIDSRVALAQALRLLGELRPARQAITHAVERARSGQGSSTIQLGLALNELAALEIHHSNMKAATPAADESLHLLSEAADPRRTLPMVLLAQIHHASGQRAEARSIFEQALEIDAASIFGRHGSRYVAHSQQLATVLQELGEWAMAAKTLKIVAESLSRTHGNAHPDLAATYLELGRLDQGRKRFESAEHHFRSGLKLGIKVLGAEHWFVGYGKENLGTLALDRNDPRGAATWLGEAVDIYRHYELQPVAHAAGAMTFHSYALLALHQPERALKAGEEGLSAFERIAELRPTAGQLERLRRVVPSAFGKIAGPSATGFGDEDVCDRAFARIVRDCAWAACRSRSPDAVVVEEALDYALPKHDVRRRILGNMQLRGLIKYSTGSGSGSSDSSPLVPMA